MISRSAGLYLFQVSIIDALSVHGNEPQKLFNKIDVRQHHAPTAVPVKTNDIHRITGEYPRKLLLPLERPQIMA